MKLAIVSGAGRGIGAATARELGHRGYHVLVNYHRDAAAAALVVKDITAAGGSAEALQADVRDPAQVAELVSRAGGRVDVLVCNANTANPPFAPLAALPWEDFAAKVDGELSGVYFLTQQVLELMRPRGAGRIVYVSSTAADKVGSVIAHSTAKAALNTFSRHVAADAARSGITVNTVAPGPVHTDATAAVLPGAATDYLRERSVAGRLLEPSDIGRAIALLADDGFGAATGQVIRLDGGLDVLEQQLDGLAGIFAAQA
ncbi:3-oxoacyl-[acyl-carrier protein] reductase [Amycolatopsis xylanica]|uniref:3-oxoacyl-[acyl-carrier protein] reductase n=1 Tax=Amycolatopsis xylanica TaxID=589385 RepID=A0A1H3G1B4_9PSEU|nr:SDR family oxidoreductase [Amycolatopsis xylanica]SDX96920.1 3-oxoacyl-[acyl-carrier protein] reductase [Amycolatopsis xylanica]